MATAGRAQGGPLAPPGPGRIRPLVGRGDRGPDRAGLDGRGGTERRYLYQETAAGFRLLFGNAAGAYNYASIQVYRVGRYQASIRAELPGLEELAENGRAWLGLGWRTSAGEGVGFCRIGKQLIRPPIEHSCLDALLLIDPEGRLGIEDALARRSSPRTDGIQVGLFLKADGKTRDAARKRLTDPDARPQVTALNQVLGITEEGDLVVVNLHCPAAAGLGLLTELPAFGIALDRATMTSGKGQFFVTSEMLADEDLRDYYLDLRDNPRRFPAFLLLSGN